MVGPSDEPDDPDDDRDAAISIPLEFEEALAALLAVDPDAAPDDEVDSDG